MDDSTRIVVYFEGDDDKAFLEGLQRASLLPPGWELAKRDRRDHPGKDGLVRQMLPLISPVNGLNARAVALIDLDEHSVSNLADWFQKELASRISSDSKLDCVTVHRSAVEGRIQVFSLRTAERAGHVALVPVGNPDDSLVNERYKITSFAIDDWVFRLTLNRQVFEKAGDVRHINHDTALTKYMEVAEVFRRNSLEVHTAKSYIQILRAVASIRPATATIVGRLVDAGFEAFGSEAFSKLIEPFLLDLSAADRLIRSV